MELMVKMFKRNKIVKPSPDQVKRDQWDSIRIWPPKYRCINMSINSTRRNMSYINEKRRPPTARNLIEWTDLRANHITFALYNLKKMQKF